MFSFKNPNCWCLTEKQTLFSQIQTKKWFMIYVAEFPPVNDETSGTGAAVSDHDGLVTSHNKHPALKLLHSLKNKRHFLWSRVLIRTNKPLNWGNKSFYKICFSCWNIKTFSALWTCLSAGGGEGGASPADSGPETQKVLSSVVSDWWFPLVVQRRNQSFCFFMASSSLTEF